MTLHQWCTRESWNGRAIRDEIGKGVVLAALGVLAAHFAGRHR